MQDIIKYEQDITMLLQYISILGQDITMLLQYISILGHPMDFFLTIRQLWLSLKISSTLARLNLISIESATEMYNLSENDKVIYRLTTVRDRTYHKMTKLFTHKKSLILHKHYLSKDIICLKMTKLFAGASLPQSELGLTTK